jgi:hypothetical protein
MFSRSAKSAATAVQVLKSEAIKLGVPPPLLGRRVYIKLFKMNGNVLILESGGVKMRKL